MCLATVMTVYMCMKAALTQTTFLDISFSFHVATATYLVAMAKGCDQDGIAGASVSRAPHVLQCIPELLAENLQDFLLFVHRFKDHMFEVSYRKSDAYLLLILHLPVTDYRDAL